MARQSCKILSSNFFVPHFVARGFGPVPARGRATRANSSRNEAGRVEPLRVAVRSKAHCVSGVPRARIGESVPNGTRCDHRTPGLHIRIAREHPDGLPRRETIVFTGADQLEEIFKSRSRARNSSLQPQPTRTYPLAAQLILTLRWSVPYRVDIRNVADDALDRLVELGAIDAESGGHGEIAALMPDSVESRADRECARRGAGDISVSPATGRDAGSVWVLSPRPIRIGRLTIVPAHAAAEAGLSN